VFWIGSGVSADAGLPTWEKLRKTLSHDALEELASWPPSDADAHEAKLVEAESSKNLWGSFQILQEILGYPTYRSLIRDQLGPSDQVELPKLHELVWGVPGVRGVVSLNIDGLEGRAHRLVRTNETVDEFVGRDLKKHLPTLQNKKQFIARLHGHHSDSSSWIFTEKDLRKLLSDSSYTTAIQALFSGYIVVFLGISADDAAAGGFLQAMVQSGLDMGEHFWISNRVDEATRKWSDEAEILRVPYSVDKGETHTSVIEEMFCNIAEFSSKDEPAEPVDYFGSASSTIPALEELRKLPEDDVRKHLNSYAKHLLSEGANRTDTKIYQSFLEDFSPAIHQSWHLSEAEGYNKFFDYRAVEKVHSGPFSSVWRVQDDDYKQFALKVMQIDNLRKGPQMDSFRRGIASQKLMKDSLDFDGIAKIERAYEIPPSVVMEFVEGENIEEICDRTDFDFWSDGLKALINCCSIIVSAHKSKFGVLHRDVRPQNIMLPNFYFGSSASDHGLDQHAVKLLNYDLTWHKDASGKVVPVDQLSLGYFAPELLNEPDSTRARDARVDSYGVGMTLYRVASGKTPPIGGSKSSEWLPSLQFIKKTKNLWFKSAHNYLSRLIKEATEFDPSDRLLVSDIEIRLRELEATLEAGVENAEGKFLAENLMYAICLDEFEADKSGRAFKRDLGGYRSYQIEAVKEKNCVQLSFSNSSINTDDWGKIDKAWTAKLQASSEILVSGGWKVLPETGYNNRVINLSASVDLKQIRSEYAKAEAALVRAVDRVKAN